MEEKVVCFYCGTVYQAADEKCPLCGGTLREENPQIPQPLERKTEESRKEREKEEQAAPKKEEKKKESSGKKSLLVAALIFLSLAVLVLFWFILDMIGWLPGLEDRIDRTEAPYVSVNNSCTVLKAEPTELVFDAPGKSRNLKLLVNASCEETLYCNSADESVATVSQDAIQTEGPQEKSVIFTVNSVAMGTTEISVTCGNQSLTVPVSVGVAGENAEDMQTTDPTDEALPLYTPELSRQEISFTVEGDCVELKLANPVEGAEVTWTSSDPAVASVNSKGVVTAGSTSGEAEITCSVNGSEAKVKVVCDIQVKATVSPDNNGAHLETTDATVKVGEKFPLFLYDKDGEHIDEIKYVIDDPSICEVNKNYVKALKKGNTQVRVVYNGEEYICVVRVKSK